VKHNAENANIQMLRLVAERMGLLKDEVVFLGGAIMPFLVTKPTVRVTRFTKDVDFIIEPETKEELYEFEDELRELGFKKTFNGAVCQWVVENVGVDILPADPDILGFDNRWCAEAKRSSIRVNIGQGLIINMVSGHCFLGLKLCAFRRRGRGNYWKSYDIDDLILVIGGRPEIEEEVTVQASPELKAFIVGELKRMCKTVDDFSGEVLQPFEGTGPRSQVTVEAILRIERIIRSDLIKKIYDRK
jgi:hypothetical protein